MENKVLQITSKNIYMKESLNNAKLRAYTYFLLIPVMTQYP